MSELQDALSDWISDVRNAGRADRTVIVYEESVRFYLRWSGAAGSADVTRSSVRQWLAHLDADGKSAATRRIRFAAMRLWCAWLVAEQLLPVSPMDGLHAPRVTPPVVEPLTPAELDRILTFCGRGTFQSARDRACLSLLAASGLRRAECSSILLANIDWEARQILVQGKGGKVRVVDYNAMTGKFLRRYRRRRALHRYADSPFLWLGMRGHLSPDGIGDLCLAAGKRAGIDGVHAHQFRHGWAQSKLDQGLSEGSLKVLAGWSPGSSAMLARYTAHGAQARALREVRALEERGKLAAEGP